ncbi:uncharacterized protein B0T23DRAFT_411026 [Neurospora hispaniola]|uniref:Uncharacterized protein n=1 Tax=Neurospora hispaniola TaxID=588809 RepID=A0AAJ0MU64_9PEZI|nr:hypothetical protein B0T23DRAFT_411026 [Neurospora hispaniola]
MPRSTCREARKHTEDKVLAAPNHGIAAQKGFSTNAKMIDHHHFPYLHDASPCRSQRHKSALQHGEGTLRYPPSSVPPDDLDLTRNVNYWLVGNPLPRRTHAYLSGDGHGTEGRAMWYEVTFMSYWRRRRRRRGPVPRVLGAITALAFCWQLPRYLVWGKIYLGKMGGWMGGLPLVCSSKRRKGSLSVALMGQARQGLPRDDGGYNGFALWCAVIKGIVSVSANSNNAAPSRCLQLYKLGKNGNDKVFKGVGYLALEETRPYEPISGYTAKELELSLGSGAVLGFPAALPGVEFTARNNRASC